MVRPALARLEKADWHGLEHGPAVAYLLAHARREAFYIDVADNLAALRTHWDRIVMQQKMTLPATQLKLPLLVWFEPSADAASAQARIEHIRTLPHAWKRHLVETMNPAWLDLYAYFKKHPIWMMTAIGERGALFRDLRMSEAEQAP
ncbi:endonuclease [Solilutibacter pythonis]|uniref:endonuclease n=1 Tax=Solilutibacter pythonis TaxID=2483112 RepID=UPI001FE28CB6|nr:endonuclease [Lysobacter pythonis]